MISSKSRVWDFPSILRLLAAIWLVGLRLEITHWNNRLYLDTILLIAALIFGVLAGISRLRRRDAALLGVALGLAFIPMVLSFLTDLEPSASPLARLYMFFLQLGSGLGEFGLRQPVQSPMLFVTTIGIAFWALGFSAGFLQVRLRQSWAPILLAGLGILVIDNAMVVDKRDVLVSGLFFFLFLLIAGRNFYIELRRKWAANRIPSDTESGFDMDRSVLAAGALVILLAWNIPTAVEAFTPGTRQNREFSAYMSNLQDQLRNFVSPLDNPTTASVYGYGNVLAPGTSVSSSEKVAFIVTAPGPREEGMHFYWRARVYDQYADSQWADTFARQKSYGAEVNFGEAPEYTDSIELTFGFRANVPLGTLFTTGSPSSVTRPSRVLFSTPDDAIREAAAIFPDRTIESGDTYVVKAWINSPTVSDLRNAGVDYPGWIEYQYLQLPDDISQRVRDLAVQITANETTEYDRVMAITRWLRTNLTYSRTMPELPPNRELVDWVLFDIRKGFCTHYATSEVILLRSIGIPARLVAGYAQGTASDSGRTYTVLLKDSHVWPEVYFPGIGWVDFEPTTTIIPQNRPVGELPVEDELESSHQPTAPAGNVARQNNPDIREILEEDMPLGPSEFAPENTTSPWWYVAGGVVLAGLAVWLWYRRQRKRNRIDAFPELVRKTFTGWSIPTPRWLQGWIARSKMKPIEKAFLVAPWCCKMLGQPAGNAMTPQEQVNLLNRLLPEGEAEAGTLLEEYQKEIFSPKPADLAKARAAGKRLFWIAIQSRLAHGSRTVTIDSTPS